MEKNTEIYNSTIKMYETTIKQMEERGCSEQDIQGVKDALDSFIASVEYETNMAYEVPKEKLVDMRNQLNISSINPLRSNMFIVHVGGIPIYLPHYVGYDFSRNRIIISFYETEEFSPFHYLRKNNDINEVRIDYLDMQGNIVRVETFSKLKRKRLSMNGLSYRDDTPRSSYVTFKFKEHGVTTCKKERNLSETKVEDREEEEKTNGLGDNQEEHSEE